MSENNAHTRLEQARKAAGYQTAREAAEALGVAYPSYAAHENGQRGLARVAERYAKFFKVSLDWLLTGKGSGPGQTPAQVEVPRPNATVGEKLKGPGIKIPVYGQAVGGVNGEFLMNGNILFEVMAPPTLSDVSGAYGISISGESMYPRYEDGEVAFIDPRRRVRKGDYVVVQIQLEENGPLLAYVKKFVKHNAEEIVLEQFNPPMLLKFPGDSVVSVHFIALAGVA
ncbi:LexA family transcriptional regulator [Agrobacterium rubi]|uniref:Helix-turn-helix transcriptional regulator n=1 Tax=Agrobacterium rubi TaxID=28099 RepID=A0ABX2J2N6_9HYPH|nr:helix-turn-helix transcriptional regulator [Agrobacterium rubi]NTF35536.1 helix-turn-helix transcriptional regulator [Agrobacterium rubi]